MNKAMCVVPVSAMRAEANHKAEQVSQLLLGEVCEVLDQKDDFYFIRTILDSYEGWCQQPQLQIIADDQAYFPTVLSNKWVSEIMINGLPMQLPLGCNIGFVKNEECKVVGPYTFSSPPGGYAVPLQPGAGMMQNVAMQYINTSYQWGGRTVFGVDCSGFVQMVYRFCGLPLLRDASQQATQGEVVDFLQEVKSGDLAFFDNEEGRINHVGLMLSPNTIIHASGKVRIDTIDHAGILNRESGQRTHKLRIIKRMLV